MNTLEWFGVGFVAGIVFHQLWRHDKVQMAFAWGMTVLREKLFGKS